MKKRFLEWLKKNKRKQFIRLQVSCLLPGHHVDIHRTRMRKEKANDKGSTDLTEKR